MSLNMKITTTILLLVTISAFAQETNETARLREQAARIGVDLAKQPNWSRNQTWSGKKLTDVLKIEDITRVVLTKAVTSAPAEIDIMNILRLLSSDSIFEEAPKTWDDNASVYEAVLICRDQQVFLLRLSGGCIRLTSRAGHGFLKQTKPSNSGGPADGRQPVRAQTNHTSTAVGSVW
jgi:hypothetical protein